MLQNERIVMGLLKMPTFAEQLAGHLTDQMSRGTAYTFSPDRREIVMRDKVTADEIKDVSVEWDAGEESDNYEYGLSPRLPKLEVNIWLHDDTRIPVDPGWVIETLMKRALR